MTTEYGITLTLNPQRTSTGNTIYIADEMLSSYEILSGKNQPYAKAIVKFDRSLYESESSWNSNTIPDVVDGQSRLSIQYGPYGHFSDYVIAKHTTSDLYVSFECYDCAYLLKTTELSKILIPALNTGYLDAKTPFYPNSVGLVSVTTQDYIFVPSSSLKLIDSATYTYSADLYLSIAIRRASSTSTTRYLFCMLQGTIVLTSGPNPVSGTRYAIRSIDRFQGDLVSLFKLCCNFVKRDCFAYFTPPTITTTATYPNNWLLNESIGWSTTPSGFHEESQALTSFYNASAAGIGSLEPFSEKEQYYGYLVLDSSTSSRTQYITVTAENVDQLVTVGVTIPLTIVNPPVKFDIRTNEFASSVLSALAESYNMLYFFTSVYEISPRSDGYLLPKNPLSGTYTANSILFSGTNLTDLIYILGKIVSITPSRTVSLDYTDSIVDFLTAPQISNQGTGDLITSVTVASENYQGSMSYTSAPFSGKSNNIYVPYVDQDNEKGTIEEIQENLTYAKKFLKRIAYNILRSNKADQNMCSYSTQELQPKIISVETLPTSDIDTNAIYAVLDPNTLGETCYKRSGSTWVTVTPTFTYSDPFPYDFATINDVINGKTLTSVPLAALHTRYPECTTTWLWGYPPYLDTEASLNDLTKNSLVGTEQGTENITISENYAARIIVGDSDPDELPPSDPSTGNRLYDPTNQSLGGFTGLIQERNEDSGIYRLAGYDNGIVQAQFRTDGKIEAGEGSTILDADGLTILYDPTDVVYNAKDSLKYIDKTSLLSSSGPIVPFRMYYLNNGSILDAQEPANNLSLRYKDGAVSFSQQNIPLSSNGYRTYSAQHETQYQTYVTDVGGTTFDTLLSQNMSTSSGNVHINHTSSTAKQRIGMSGDPAATITANKTTSEVVGSQTISVINTNELYYSGGDWKYLAACSNGVGPVFGHELFMVDAFFAPVFYQNKQIGSSVGTFFNATISFDVDVVVTANVSGQVTLYLDDDSQVIATATFNASSDRPDNIQITLHAENVIFPSIQSKYLVRVVSNATNPSTSRAAAGVLSSITFNIYSITANYEYDVVTSQKYSQIFTYHDQTTDTDVEWSIISDPTRILKFTNLNLNGWKNVSIAEKYGSTGYKNAIQIGNNSAFYTDVAGKELILVAESDESYGSTATCTVGYNQYSGAGGQIGLDDNGSTHYGQSIFRGDVIQLPSSASIKGSAIFNSEVFYINSTICEVKTNAMLVAGSLTVVGSLVSSSLTVGGLANFTGTMQINDPIRDYLRNRLHPSGSDYIYLSSNLVLSWGSFSNGGGSRTVTFPIPYSSNPVVTATKNSNDDDSGGNDWTCVVTGFNRNNENTKTVSVRFSMPDDSSEWTMWTAIGFV